MNKTIRILVSGLLLGWFAWHISWPEIVQVFAQLRPELWLAAVVVLIAVQLVSAVRWQLLAVPLGFNRPLRHMIGFYFIGMYFNLMLPTSVGGDVVRAWYLDGGSGRRLRAFVSVFLDRCSGLAVLLSLACLGVLLSPRPLPRWITVSIWSCTACAVLGVAVLPLLIRYSRLAPWKIRTALEALGSLPSLRVWLWPTVLSVGVQVGNVVLVWLLGEAIGAQVPPSFYWILVPMVSLLTLLPSINGTGIRELSVALLLAPLGVAEERAGALALLWFAVSALVSLLGGLVYLFGRFPRPVLSSPSPQHKVTTANGPVRGDSDQGRTGQSKTAA